LKGEIKICNDGYGIRVHKWIQDELIYISIFIFVKYLTLHNFNDNQKTNNHTKFIVETSSKGYLKKSFKQIWSNNMCHLQDTIINKTFHNPKEFTRIIFTSDLKQFQMDKFDDDDLVSLFK
ncbi:unnamed protein product, partial [Rotaria sordida]